ncbi:MAG: hypothetical protein ABR559_02240 [Gemmatimonadota bacterium]
MSVRLAIAIVAVTVAAGAACSAAREEGAPPATVAGSLPADTVRGGAAGSTGFLSWEDLGVRLIGRGSDAGLRIDVSSLGSDAVALAADDVRAYFTDVRKRIPEAVPGDAATELTPFLVGYSAFEKEISFDPTRLQIRSEGSTYYPQYVIPVSPRFERRVVDLYETVYAIYLFDAGLDLDATLEFQYAELTSGGAWRGVVERIQRAKAQRRSDE